MTKLVVPPMPVVERVGPSGFVVASVAISSLDDLEAWGSLGWQTAQRESEDATFWKCAHKVDVRKAESIAQRESALADELAREMERYLPVLENLERIPLLWGGCTDGTGIATLNGYRHVLAKRKEARNG